MLFLADLDQTNGVMRVGVGLGMQEALTSSTVTSIGCSLIERQLSRVTS